MRQSYGFLAQTFTVWTVGGIPTSHLSGSSCVVTGGGVGVEAGLASTDGAGGDVGVG
jgi:hypothetical protein